MTLAEIEKLIDAYQDQIDAYVAAQKALIADLREKGIRTDEARRMPGQAARKWLTDRGATSDEATDTICAVLRERIAQGGHLR